MPEEAGGMVIHLVHLPGSTGVGVRHRQHDAVLAPTTVKLLQGYHFRYTPHPKEDWCG